MAKHSSDFFGDLHSSFIGHSSDNTSIKSYLFSTLQLYFELVSENGDECLVLLENIKFYLRQYILKDSEENVEDVLLHLIATLLKCKTNYSLVLNKILLKCPSNIRNDFREDIDYIMNNIPIDLFLDKYKPSDGELEFDKIKTTQEKLFSIPISFKVEKKEIHNIDNLFKYVENKPDSAKSSKYPLFERYELYRSKIMVFSKYADFMDHIVKSLESSKNNEELFNDLLDTLGCEVFDFIKEMVENRYSDIDFSSPFDDETVRKYLSKRNQMKNGPALASQVIVQSEEEKNLAKKLRKLEKKERGKFSDEIESVSDDLRTEQMRPMFRRIPEVVETFPHVYDNKFTKFATIHKGSTIKLPENAVQKRNNLFTEISIPADNLKDYKDGFKLVDVKDLDVTGQLVFKDIEKFNRIQSEVFPVAYNTNENLLICAPTGAGKTNIALLAMVHQIKAHMVDNTVQHSNFKIIYVSPMKALATEMVANFSKKLSSIGVRVKELTGDMQLTRKQIAETHVIVSTPEKFDVITRKGAVDTEIASQMKLLIIDEVHLLNGTRGPVIETIVARVLRQVVSTQSMIRIVALSATLPGYLDVASFLRVNPHKGLFFFDNRFRSVPLSHTYIGINTNPDNLETMNKVCYQQMKKFIKNGHQVMVFVTARNQTVSAINSFIAQAKEHKEIEMFVPNKSYMNLRYNFKNSYLHEFVTQGFGTHHAGLCRSDRLEIESLFRNGFLKVIVCTATLAWGVNLPAHAVLIRGTTMYDPQQSKFVDMDVLDVLQIFGRAGRPQYDTSGHATIITSQAKMSFYMNMLMSQTPIESRFLDKLPDNLNGEIVLGTISNVKEALEWLQSSYLFHRLRKNPLNYGLNHTEIAEGLEYDFLQRQLVGAAKVLEKAEMIRFDERTGELRPTSYGRIASYLYITHETITLFMEKLRSNMMDDEILILISSAVEFQQIQVRNDELEELDRLRREYVELESNLDVTTVEMKVMVLIQTCISRGFIRLSSLVSDSEYIMQNVVRLASALHQLAVERNFASLVETTLVMSQMLEQRTWSFCHPLSQFKDMNFKGMDIMSSINISIEELRAMPAKEIIDMARNRNMGLRILHAAKAFPLVTFDMVVKPITEGVIRIRLLITPDFKWDNSIHGGCQQYVAMVEDPMHDNIYHFEKFIITERNCSSGEPIELYFTVPLIAPHAEEYFVKIINLHFLHTKVEQVINFNNITLLPSHGIETAILNVHPLPKTALRNPLFESIYPFDYFNAVQSQVFHSCYNTESNILLGAPTGSGKTIVSELCILRLFTNEPERKVVYIAPMKALVRERVKDWCVKFQKLKKNVVEITGDVTPKSDLITSANIIITTPEKWDGMSRNWHQKDFVKSVGLMIIDEIHLLAEERGPVLEVIVSRMNYINSFSNGAVRMIGLSTAMANAGDLANWLGVKEGLFNFSSSVRPVPLEIHITGFSGKNYCPRMATMNRPAYQSICQYAPDSPTLIFVSSRKQTRITAHELIKQLMVDINEKQWRRCSEEEIEMYRSQVHDNDLSYMLQFGVAIHHAGLQDKDRDIVEELFVNQKIQVLIATATLAWGVNFPAHLVIVKGTEYFDGATKRYVDMPVTDVLQMLGRAGRPQFDKSGVACVFVEESKKSFYKKFLFEPFPVESCLLKVLPDHVNAEISNGTIGGKEQLIDFICSTFFFRRLLINPSYYQQEPQEVKTYLGELADSVAMTLNDAGCIDIQDENPSSIVYESTFLGHLAARYYLTYKTIVYFEKVIKERSSIDDLLITLCQAEEYALFPVRHNEDKINKQMMCDLKLNIGLGPDSPHLKIYLLIYCYMNGVELPNQEYVIDLKSVFDQIIRIIQATISLTSFKGWLDCTMKLIYISQMVLQGLTITSSNLMMLPLVNESNIQQLTVELDKNLPASHTLCISVLQELLKTSRKSVTLALKKIFGDTKMNQVLKVIQQLPDMSLQVIIKDKDSKVIDYQLCEDQKAIKTTLPPDTPYLVIVNVERKGGNLNVFSRNFSKQKDESWFYLLSKDNYLEDFQRGSFRSNKSFQNQLFTPTARGTYTYVIQLMSDSYIGLDQKIVLNVMVK
ncbi:activating signal cointegrator 1 complex subunit 3-like [Harmonia axyridis]|uniref:activating signal cointegrator 1 complex subunit 3-like n=1 Tax=Harmonia axyridis TaxID=115357 RepID=UPI001E2751AD|nr:activating signal cointegrator 1 complex subunit 3-like [Harmonia axyridis]